MKTLKMNRQESEVTDLSKSFLKKPFSVLGIFIFLLFAGLSPLKAQTTVNPGDDLNSIINNSSGGTITVNSGTYGPLLVEYKDFSATNPLIIKASDGADVTIKRSNWDRKNPHTGSYDAAVFTECSYIAFDNIKFTGDGQAFSVNDRGVWIHDSHHLIFRNCEFTETQQEGVKVEAASQYIDFIDCLFADTGLGKSWFGEGLYVGRGSYKNWGQWPDTCKYVWVEDSEFRNIGRGEAINIKAEAFHCTIRNNDIHDITLNVHDFDQTNSGAISLDHSVGYQQTGITYKEGERRENWVENNTITKTRSGIQSWEPYVDNNSASRRRIAGIYSAGTGNNIVGNTVTDVTNGALSEEANGIRFNTWDNDRTKNIAWNNDITNAEDGDDFDNIVINQNPGTNPNSAQSWYPAGGSSNCEILTNGGFDSNVSNWQSWGCNAYSSNGAANITSINTGANVWDAAFRQTGKTMQQGKTYTLTFRARANSNRSMTLKAGMHVSPWTSYLFETVNLTTSMQNYTYTFTMSNATNTDASVEFYFANNSSNIYIDNVSLKENGCGGNNCPSAGTSCDDGDPATYNDVEDGNCNCAGTACPSAGTSCDDGNPNTINDQQDGNCNCVGTSCPSAGTPCDDGNPNTINDVQDGNCNCAGTPIQTGNCELVTNGGFDSNVSNWQSWGCNAYSSNGAANITSINTGANVWDAAFRQTGTTMQQGKTYTLTFRARANSNRSMTLKAGMHVSPWTSYLYETVNLTTSMQNYSYTFTMSNATNTDASIEFYFANNSSNIYIDNVSLKESNCGTPTTCEVLTNGDFDANTSDWNSWGCSPSVSSGVANITSINAGSNTWDAGFIQQGLTIEQGKTYTVTFRARADANRSILVKSGIAAAPWTTYLYETVNLSTSMQTYTLTFTMNNATNTNARFEFFLGGNSTNVYIDYVSMSADCNNKQDLSATPDIELYPSPANHNIQLTCKLSENTQADIQVYDAFGKLVKHIPDVEIIVSSPTSIEVSQLPAGVYFCTLQSGEWQAVKKFVIAR